MLRKLSFCLPMIAVALCLLAGAAFASDACSPTNPNAKTASVQIPEAGTPKTPAGGVADGWVLLYKDSSFTQLTHEVYCRNNKIEFAARSGEANFQANPDCDTDSLYPRVRDGKLHKAALKSDTGNANKFMFAAKKNAFGLTGFTVLHTFTGCPADGAQNQSGVIQDANGNLYGTTRAGGNGTCSGIGRAEGTVYEVSPASGGSATETILHTFSQGSGNGWESAAGLAFDSSGNLWSQTIAGGTGSSCSGGSCGVIYELTSGSGGTWNESSVYSFLGYAGNYLEGSTTGLTLNQSSGVFYSASILGDGAGAIWSLNGSTVNNIFTNVTNPGGNLSLRGYLALDSAGNLYGTTGEGGTFGEGDVYQLNPSTGVATTLYSFQGGLQDGCTPASEPILDAAGNIYGTTGSCNVYLGGNVWKLTPQAGGTYSYTQLYQFCMTGNAPNCTDGQSPYGGLAIDSFGNIYGTTGAGGDVTCGTSNPSDYGGCGTLFRISPAPAGGCPSNTYIHQSSYCETVLHVFEEATDGAYPQAVTLAPDGDLYGTTSA